MLTSASPLQAMQARHVETLWRKEIIKPRDRPAADQSHRTREAPAQLGQQLRQGRIDDDPIGPIGDLHERAVEIEEQSPWVPPAFGASAVSLQ